MHYCNRCFRNGIIYPRCTACCPKYILSYWKEAGRCVRDGRQGFSLMLYDGFRLALETTDKDMAAVVKNDFKTCIRQLIVETLGDEKMPMSQTSSCEGCNLKICLCFSCKCCSVCASKCKCQERCKCYVNSFLSTCLNESSE